MAGVLSGLGELGLGDLENISIFETEKEKEKEKETIRKNTTPVKVTQIEEKDFIFDKKVVCPVCEKNFLSKVMKSGKAKLKSLDIDLRPIYEGIDQTKYEVYVCSHCGYSVLSRFYSNIIQAQARLIREKITPKIKLREYLGAIYTYEEAIERYKIALACTVVKQGKAGEKAYVCLKSAWLIRGYKEDLLLHGKLTTELAKELEKQEVEYIKNAFEGFSLARKSEVFPICGMNEMTFDYLLSALAYRLNYMDISSRLLSIILISTTAEKRIKDKARELKDIILEKQNSNKDK